VCFEIACDPPRAVYDLWRWAALGLRPTGRLGADLRTHGARKYPISALLASSVGRGWSSLGGELRSHAVGQTPAVKPRQLEITLAVSGSTDGHVTRTGAGEVQQAVPRDGTIWISPVAVGDNVITIEAELPAVLHLYVPIANFENLKDDYNLSESPAHSVRYLAGVRDEMIQQIGLSVLAEMTRGSSAGRMLIDSASMLLAAKLVHSYADHGSVPAGRERSTKPDQARIERVIEFIRSNIENDITIDDLAQVACLSRFHFARMFAATVGEPPHKYVSRMRLENAMEMLAAGNLTIEEVAARSRFASQSSFTRAFRRATGISPGSFRQSRE
jgi:AraC family transcriptional regulator